MDQIEQVLRWKQVVDGLKPSTAENVQFVAFSWDDMEGKDDGLSIHDPVVQAGMVEYLMSENMEDGLLSLDALEIHEILQKARDAELEVKVKPELHYQGYAEFVKGK
jgi:hypothetical protein